MGSDTQVPGRHGVIGVMAYAVVMPFMSALAPTQWTPLPLIFVAFAAPWIIVNAKRPRLLEVLRLDAGFIATWLIGCLAIFNSPLGPGGKNINYAAAFVVSYIAFLVVIRAWITGTKIDWQTLSRAATASLTFLSIAVILEFITASFFGVFFSDVIPFAHDNLEVGNLVVEGLKRPRAFSAEPGFTALAFESLWPLTWMTIRRQWARQGLFLAAYLLLASAASVVSILVAMIILWVVRGRNVRPIIVTGLIVAPIAYLLASTDAGREMFWSAFGRKLDLGGLEEATGNDSVTVLDRLSAYTIGVSLLFNQLTGIGWGTLGEAFSSGAALPGVGSLSGSGMLSLYLDVAVASGIAGVILFVWFIWARVFRVARSSHEMAPYVTVSLAAVAVHHVLITEWQFPFLWFSVALADKLLLGSGTGGEKLRGQFVVARKLTTSFQRATHESIGSARQESAP